MIGDRMTFHALTDHPGLERVEIPLFQRDYAQGRRGATVEKIRSDLLDALRDALSGSEPVGLDFIYGGLENGRLQPLDGQQRLTTLFLLHWYVASRSGRLDPDQGWQRFTYATRQSARMFCERLVEEPLPAGVDVPSAWIVDQPWYLHLWRHDPTIQAMLVMIDAIHDKFSEVDAETAWLRLTDRKDPAVWFLLLPLSDLQADNNPGSRPEDLYVKMNSRGRPLTEFETFKAGFEATIRTSPRIAEFTSKVDTDWSDLFWTMRGEDDHIDDAFLNYLEFVIEICEWRDGRSDGATAPLAPRAELIFGTANPAHRTHLDFLFSALDVWREKSSTDVFDDLFTTGADDPSLVRLFFTSGRSSDRDLFAECLASYRSRHPRRVFTLGQTVLLYGVLIHLLHDTPDANHRLRMLRNLVEASSNELRQERMPQIIDDVEKVIRHGDVAGVSALNRSQAAAEIRKAAFLHEHPDLRYALHRLEDHALLRGSLGSFELEAASFTRRAEAFREIMERGDLWSQFTGALLASGEYQRQRSKRVFLFGTDSTRHDDAWRELLTGVGHDALEPTRITLARCLDRLSAASTPLPDTLGTITTEYLTACRSEQRFDWRYYMVAYPAMREDGSSTYYAERDPSTGEPALGYGLVKLRAGGKRIGGHSRDPYLSALRSQLSNPGRLEDHPFTEHEDQPRRLPLVRSGATIRCIPTGFELQPPQREEHAAIFQQVTREYGVGPDGVVAVPQTTVAGRAVDTVDRVRLGAALVERLLAAGL